jgi:hypothetical protein
MRMTIGWLAGVFWFADYFIFRFYRMAETLGKKIPESNSLLMAERKLTFQMPAAGKVIRYRPTVSCSALARIRAFQA